MGVRWAWREKCGVDAISNALFLCFSLPLLLSARWLTYCWCLVPVGCLSLAPPAQPHLDLSPYASHPVAVPL